MIKRITTFFTAAVILAAAAAGCHREFADFNGSGDGSEQYSESELGYISFAETGLNVEWSGEYVNTPTGSDDFPELEPQTATRAQTANPDDFKVTIRRTSPEAADIVTKSFREFKNDNAPYALPISRGGKQCIYIIEVSSGTMADTAWEGDAGQPTYRGRSAEPFSVNRTCTKDNPLQLPDIRCRLESVKISVALEQSMAELSSNVTLTAKIFDPEVAEGAESAPYSLIFADSEGAHPFGIVALDEESHLIKQTIRESDYGYFKPVADKSAITLHIELDYGEDGYESVRIVQDIKICDGTNPAEANQYRRVLLYITRGEDDDLGKLIIHAGIETWTYGEEVVVDVVSKELLPEEYASEQNIPDIDHAAAPRITSPDFTFDDVTPLDASNYYRGDYNGSANVDIEATSEVAAFAVRLWTDNAELSQRFGSLGVQNGYIDMMDNSNSATEYARTFLNTLGFPRRVAIEGLDAFTVDIRPYLNYLWYYSGSHKVALEVRDAAGLVSRRELNFDYNRYSGEEQAPSDNAPTITWPGKDMDLRYTVDDQLTVDIKIKAPLGIKSLVVEMSGEIEADLGSGGMMPTKFDLVNPEAAQEGLSEVLTELSFPVGDDVRNKTELDFDITGFMDMLAVFPGDSDFKLTVSDGVNAPVTRTIKLHINE